MMSKVMKKAWEIKREMDTPFSLCLKMAWKIVKSDLGMKTAKTIKKTVEKIKSVKGWFMAKVEREKAAYATRIGDVERETEKAVLVSVDFERKDGLAEFTAKVWMPKSVCEFR